MNYIQSTFAKKLKEYKPSLLKKCKNIKQEIINHSKHDLLDGFIRITQNDDDSLVISFADLKFEITSQDKFAFGDDKQVGLQTCFYHEDEYIFSMKIMHTGHVKFVNEFDDVFPVLEHDDTQIPLVLIHGILSTAHQKGIILLIS